MFVQKDRKLGVADGKRQYDLPLNRDEGSGFLILLIALMTFLAVLALSASFVLRTMGDRWSSGLENKLTIEVPAESANETHDGIVISNENVKSLTQEIAEKIRHHPAVKSADILSDSEIQDLISPWLGEDVSLIDVPMPGLISVQLQVTTPETLHALEKAARDISPTARLDTHETWLNDLLRFTGAMQFAALIITLIIGATTFTAVAGAIRSRMAVHKDEVELLHLMGAKDDYITSQFQRHALTLTLQGCVVGVLGAGIVMVLIGLISGDTGGALIPDFRLGIVHMIALFLLPVAACGISALTARHTVLRVLAGMP
ncbi:MAG TPA: permease [Rhodospirillaceae bacterium]|nr:permease [Rhodospirillaceae bacterium]